MERMGAVPTVGKAYGEIPRSTNKNPLHLVKERTVLPNCWCFFLTVSRSLLLFHHKLPACVFVGLFCVAKKFDHHPTVVLFTNKKPATASQLPTEVQRTRKAVIGDVYRISFKKFRTGKGWRLLTLCRDHEITYCWGLGIKECKKSMVILRPFISPY